MPSFVVHALVPPLVLLAVGLDRRKVLLLLPLTFLPDLDHFVGVPRASLHNLFVLLPALLGYALAPRLGASADHRAWYLVAFGYLASHLVMDGFNGGWTPLFPFSDATFLVTLYVLVTQPQHTYDIVFEWGVRSGPPTLSATYLWLSPFEVAMVAFVVLAVGTAWVARLLRGTPAERLD